MPEFTVKDSGARESFAGGMVRDTAKDKIRWDLVFDGPMLERLAIHLTKGAAHYGPRNWLKAAGLEEAERFRESAARHFCQWMKGDTDEDHAAALIFNIMGSEYVKTRIKAEIAATHTQLAGSDPYEEGRKTALAGRSEL